MKNHTKYQILTWILVLFLMTGSLSITGNAAVSSLTDSTEAQEDEVVKEDVYKRPFCHSSNISGMDLQEYITIHSDISQVVQGICVADGYIIATRWHSNNASTEFKIYKPNATAQRTFSARAGHANSLTYNPDKHELLVAACDDSHRIFLFSFYNGVMNLKRTITLPYEITKVCYVSSVQRYYLCTGIRMFSTADFNDIKLEFEIDAFATGQGMASDGRHIYVCWTPSGKNVIKAFSLTGQFLAEYTIPGEICNELEEIDFYQGDMLVADNRASADKIYRVSPTHSWSPWLTTTPASCVEKGLQERECHKCGNIEQKVLPINEDHLEDLPIETPATCTTDGESKTYCMLCGKLVYREVIPASGHDYGLWTYTIEPTVYHGGQKQSTCRNCGECKTEEIRKLKPVCRSREHILYLHANESCTLKLTLAAGDTIREIKSDDPLIASAELSPDRDIISAEPSADTDIASAELSADRDIASDSIVLLKSWMPGHTSITIRTWAGAVRKIPVLIQ